MRRCPGVSAESPNLMRVILFRHGPAGKRDSARWPDDGERPLTPCGLERTRLAAKGLVSLARDARRVFSSRLTRAAQTAELVAKAMDREAQVEPLDGLAPGQPARALIQRLAGLGPEESAVLVGHEPDLGQLAGLLVLGSAAALPLKKAGACAIEFEDGVRPGKGRLEWLVTPRILRGHARGAKR